MAQAGNRIIVVDPVPAAATSEAPWIDDLQFMIRIKRAVREHQCSIVLVTHPRKGRQQATRLDDVAGGSAYTRFSQTVLWIEDHEPPRNVTVRERWGAVDHQINRTANICKSRNGRGGGLKLAYQFNAANVRFEELGVIVKPDKAGENSG